MIVLGLCMAAAVPVETHQTAAHILKQFIPHQCKASKHISWIQSDARVRLYSPIHSTSRSAVNCITLIFHLIHILRVITSSFDISPLWNCRCFINACNPSKARSENLAVVHHGYFDDISLYFIFFFLNQSLIFLSRAEDVAFSWSSFAWCKWKHFTTT